MKDLVALQRWLNGWTVERNEANAEMDGNGKVNMKDYVALQRKLNGWNI